MDRVAAGSLIVTSLVMAVLGGAAWGVASPMDSWPRYVTPDGEVHVMAPSFDEAAVLTNELVIIESARRAPLLLAVVLFVSGVASWIVARKRRPERRNLYATLAPGLMSSPIAAALYTPPDIVSTLMMTGVLWAAFVPTALLARLAIGRIAARRGLAGAPDRP